MLFKKIVLGFDKTNLNQHVERIQEIRKWSFFIPQIEKLTVDSIILYNSFLGENKKLLL